MYPDPNKKGISGQTLRLVIGLIAISLAALTSYFSESSIQSISASYHVGGISRSIFEGFLFAIAAFLLAYNGKSITEMLLSKTAALAALGVAVFPCKCVCYEEIIAHVHAIAAFIMFAILAGFCLIFYKRAMKKYQDPKNKYPKQAHTRAKIYAVCGLIIVVSILGVVVDGFLDLKINRLVFNFEAAALIAFGIAWLIASRILPVITGEEERCTLSPFKKNENRNR